MKWGWLLSRRVGLMALAALLVIALAGLAVRAGPLAPVKVTAVKAESGMLSPTLFGIGTVEARRSYTLGPTAAGRVKSVQVDVGDRVRAGQILAEIDPVDLDERIRSLEAARIRAEHAVTATEAQTSDAQARLQLAEMNAKRYRDLAEKRFVSSSAAEGKQQESISARALRQSAQANLLAARQEVLRIQADLAGLRQQMQNLKLVAPQDALVASRDAEPGSTVLAGQAVIRLVASDSLWIKTRLDLARSYALTVGLPAEVILRSNSQAKLSGRIVRLEPVSDSVTEERVVQVLLDQPPAGLTVGELAEVTILLAPSQARLALPNGALKNTVQGAGVWLIREGKPHFERVVAGRLGAGGQVEILQGLRAGDLVIVHSEQEISEKTRIRIVDRLVRGAT